MENNTAAGDLVDEGDGGGLHNDVGATMTINNDGGSVTGNTPENIDG